MSAEPAPSGSVELRDYLRVFRRQLALIVAITLLGAAAAAAYTFRRTPVYESSASVLVRAITTNAFDPGSRVDQQLNMFNQRQLAQSEPVAALAAKTIKTTATPAQLLEHVNVDVPANSQILRVRYQDTVPLTAQRGADAFAKAYLVSREADARAQATTSQKSLQKDIARFQKQASAAEKQIADPDADSATRQAAQAKLAAANNRLDQLLSQLSGFQSLDFTPGTVIAAAGLPATPASPNNRLDIGIGLLVGLFLGVVLAFVRDRTDDRLRGREDLAERLDRPVLATIPPLSKRVRQEGKLRWKRRSRNSLVTLEQPNSPAAEAYRTLRTRMARLASQLDINSVMVVSAGVGEGKSTTAANLAVVLAETGKDVLLVSADLRRPRVHQFFSLQNKSGLSNLLTDGTPPDKRKGPVADGKQMASELWSVAPNLWVVLSGPLPPHPSALMDSDSMRQFLKEQRDLFDFLVLDCPPALVVADSMALAPLADAVLVVADAKESDRDMVSRLKEELEQVGGKIVGAVLNRSKQAAKSTYYYDTQDD
ncbi:MAG TPA: polysaccharide biosynthesis tyrosine autokinase [Actinomycetota bacterium]|nr:polysaccharide biosynthesis tyrosine autokinase [Actinomycetota bacterium]